MTVYKGYQGAKSCTSGPQPGAKGLMAWFLAKYKSQGGVNSGIYNCRSVRGGRTTSLHGEGRAVDLGIRPYSAKYGTQIAEALRRNSKELGIQCIIWNRKIWSGSYPNAGWRPYKGVAHHKDHLHVELTWASARHSEQRMIDLLNKYAGNAGDVKVKNSAPAPTSWKTVKYGDLLKKGTKGKPVKDVQRALGLKVDGYFGASTEKALRAYQKRVGLKADGVVGPNTWAAIKKTKSAPKPKSKATKFPLARSDWFGQPRRSKKNKSGYYSAAERPHIKKIQKFLGLSQDGKFGPGTEKAVKAFQKKKGLTADGLVGISTWKAMGI